MPIYCYILLISCHFLLSCFDIASSCSARTLTLIPLWGARTKLLCSGCVCMCGACISKHITPGKKKAEQNKKNMLFCHSPFALDQRIAILLFCSAKKKEMCRTVFLQFSPPSTVDSLRSFSVYFFFLSYFSLVYVSFIVSHDINMGANSFIFYSVRYFLCVFFFCLVLGIKGLPAANSNGHQWKTKRTAYS